MRENSNTDSMQRQERVVGTVRHKCCREMRERKSDRQWEQKGQEDIHKNEYVKKK